MNAIRPWLFIGTRKDAQNVGLLYAHGISAILTLAGEVQHPGFASRYLPIEDAEPLPEPAIRDGVDFVLEEREKGNMVLIACSGGFSRSVAFAVATLKEAEGLTLLDALLAIRERHADAQPHPVLWGSLCEYYREGEEPRENARHRHR